VIRWVFLKKKGVPGVKPLVSAEENIWIYERGSDKSIEKTT
jgi:hypothetical protein